MGWTEERVSELKKLWAEGHSASQIAKRLGSVTRNAVIGKVHRLGLSGRATPSRPVKRPPRLARPKPQVMPRQAPAAPVARGGNALALAKQAVVHENAGQAVADGFVEECRCDGGVHAAAQGRGRLPATRRWAGSNRRSASVDPSKRQCQGS